MMHSDEGQAELLDLNEIMRAFGIEVWTNLGVLEQPQAEQLQILVEVEGQRYLLRERPEMLVGQDNPHHYAFQRYLIEQGIPCAPCWLTAQGEPFIVSGEDYFELLVWREGEAFDSLHASEREWIVAAGALLGRIHRASQGYTGPAFHWPSEVQAGGLAQGWLNFARSKAEQCEVYAVASALSTMIDAWEAALPAAMMALGTGRGLPAFHIHGDYSALNLRFAGRDVSQVLGLEASRWEKRLLEVAYGVLSFAGLEWHADNDLTRPLVRRGLDPDRAGLFLSNYSAILPAVAGEAPLLVDALTLVAPIVTVNGPLEDLFYGPDNLEGLELEDVLERLAWASALPAWLQRVRRAFAEMW